MNNQNIMLELEGGFIPHHSQAYDFMMTVEGNKMNYYTSSRCANQMHSSTEIHNNTNKFYSPKQSSSISNLNKDFDQIKIKNINTNNVDYVSIPHIESFEAHPKSSAPVVDSSKELKFTGNCETVTKQHY